MYLIFALSLTVLVVFGMIYQAIATRCDRRKIPPTGQLIDINGSRLHYTGNGRR
jgi:hypothetical protein